MVRFIESKCGGRRIALRTRYMFLQNVQAQVRRTRDPRPQEKRQPALPGEFGSTF